MRFFQRDHKLTDDGLVNPAGPTVTKLAGVFGQGAPKPPRPVLGHQSVMKKLSGDAYTANQRSVAYLKTSTSDGLFQQLLADDFRAKGVLRAKAVDFLAQLRADDPDRARIVRDKAAPFMMRDEAPLLDRLVDDLATERAEAAAALKRRIDSDRPLEEDAPEQPDPGDPDDSDEPEEPEAPEEPEEPAPDQPDEPSQPSEPEKPSKPEEDPCAGWRNLVVVIRDEIRAFAVEIKKVNENLVVREQELQRREQARRDRHPTAPSIPSLPEYRRNSKTGKHLPGPVGVIGMILDLIGTAGSGTQQQRERDAAGIEQKSIDQIRGEIDDFKKTIADLEALRERKEGVLVQANEKLTACEVAHGQDGSDDIE